LKACFSSNERKETRSRGGCLRITYLDIFKRLTGMDAEAWTLPDHGLVEPVEGKSTPPEATPGTPQLEAASDAVVDIQPTPTNTPLTNADADKGPAPLSGNNPVLEGGRVTIPTLEVLRELVKNPKIIFRITEDEITQVEGGLSKAIFIPQSSWRARA